MMISLFHDFVLRPDITNVALCGEPNRAKIAEVAPNAIDPRNSARLLEWAASTCFQHRRSYMRLSVLIGLGSCKPGLRRPDFRVRRIRVESRDGEERRSTRSKRNIQLVVSDQAATALSHERRAWVLPHQHENLRRLEPRQKIAVQVRVPAELIPAGLTNVVPTRVL